MGTALVKANPLASVAGSAAGVQGGGSVTGTVTLGLYALVSEAVTVVATRAGVSQSFDLTITP